jgi:MtrB/PioB family decaheme-associated outer membrane protein
MRNRLMTVTAALLLASATSAAAQTAPAPQAVPAPGPTAPVVGTLDLGGLFGDIDGDTARYERYRDASDGVYSNIMLAREAASYSFNATASHIGYRDQRYTVDYNSRKVKVSFLWDSIPLNYYYDAITPFTRGSGTMTLPDDPQRDVQNRAAIGIPCAYASTCNANNKALADAALQGPNIYNRVAEFGFDLQSKRDTAGFVLDFAATRDLGLKAGFTSTKKDGEMPWSAAFAFNNTSELPLTMDQRTNDFSLGMEWAKSKGLIRVAWDGSWFTNDLQTLVWDNPIRLTDYYSGNPAVPWDPSGYSNGNGPAQGRMALWPNNSQNVISATGVYRLARATTLNGTVQLTKQEQDEDIIPWTINNVINQTAPSLGFPGLAKLPRPTAEASVSGLNALFNFNTRPFRNLAFQARYRYNDRDVETPEFDGTYNVRFDAVPEDVEGYVTHQYDITRQNFDAAATFSLVGYGALRFGYGHEAYERSGRGFSDVGENVVRLSYDAMSFSFFAVRLGYDYGQRRGEGFHMAGVDYEQQDAGEQPGLRYYDEADRNRSRASVNLSANPTDRVSLYFQYAYGKDEYLGDEFIPDGREQFGLLNQDFTAWNAGASVNLSEQVALGVNYGQDDFSSLQKSRNANPPPDATWTDPSRNWTLDNDETVKNFAVYMDLLQLGDAVDVRLSYDYSDSDNALVHGGPRIASLAATPPGLFVPLPNVTNTWNRLMADLKWYFTKKVGIGVGYYWEKLDVFDYATIDANGSVAFKGVTGTPRIDYLGSLITGYGARPYDGQNVFVRLLYRF